MLVRHLVPVRLRPFRFRFVLSVRCWVVVLKSVPFSAGLAQSMLGEETFFFFLTKRVPNKTAARKRNGNGTHGRTLGQLRA